MSEEDKKEEKLEFTAEGEAFGYISLDQARVRAIEHARDNRDFYGSTYSQGDLVWEVVRQEESEDYYDIRLSYRPASGFVGKPGIEQFTIDKTGPITLRQILSHPKPSTRTKTINDTCWSGVSRINWSHRRRLGRSGSILKLLRQRISY